MCRLTVCLSNSPLAYCCLLWCSSTDALSTYSNFSPTLVHLGAPGDWIMSTLPGGAYGYMSGTSMVRTACSCVLGRSGAGRGRGLANCGWRTQLAAALHAVVGVGGRSAAGRPLLCNMAQWAPACAGLPHGVRCCGARDGRLWRQDDYGPDPAGHPQLSGPPGQPAGQGAHRSKCCERPSAAACHSARLLCAADGCCGTVLPHRPGARPHHSLQGRLNVARLVAAASAA